MHPQHASLIPRRQQHKKYKCMKFTLQATLEMRLTMSTGPHENMERDELIVYTFTASVLYGLTKHR